jgi:uncharacterized membrane protein
MSFSLGDFIKKNYLAIIVCFFAVTGFIAAFTLTVEKFEVLRNPNAELACNINTVFNCGTVMKSSYSEAFGIPLSLLGVAGYPAAILTGLIYIDRKKTNRILSYLVTLPPLGAFLLSSYFMWVTAYEIGAFCPWCILSAISSVNIFFALLTIQIQENNLGFPEKIVQMLQNKLKQGWGIYFIILLYSIGVMVEWYPFFISGR